MPTSSVAERFVSGGRCHQTVGRVNAPQRPQDLGF